MKKPADLRAHLGRWVPDLSRNPDKLHLFIENGRIASRFGASLSFEYRYQLQIIITDFAESTDVIIVPLLVWVLENQPNLLFDEKLRDSIASFRAEPIDHDKTDIEFTLDLSERVLVKAQAGGSYQCEHIGEPPLPELDGPINWQLYLAGEPLQP